MHIVLFSLVPSAHACASSYFFNATYTYQLMRLTNVFNNEGWPHLVSLTTLRSPEAKTKTCCILKYVNVCCSSFINVVVVVDLNEVK